MKMHSGMGLEPAIVLGFVSIKLVENDVNFLFLAVGVMMPFMKSRNSRRRRRL